ncbi:MAG TPA: DUF3276 family protein [Saprospiraceae bacterium]|nr:DUF3276 family protein [Saprospiraceae bacterium]HMQ83504.1 DUF3276 family protein [Saprospiraceae bacterium]
MEKSPLFSERVKNGSRNYFIDLRKSNNGAPYLSITESKKSKDNDEAGYETTRILIFEEGITKFSEAISRLMVQYEQIEPAKAV